MAMTACGRLRPFQMAALMTDLLVRRVSESRAGAEGHDDYDVIGADGLVIGRIFKASTAPAGRPWT